MLMKRFGGGGDNWRIHMDFMVIVFQGCPLINLPTISAPLVATRFYRDNEHNNQIKIDNLGGKWVLDNTRRGG